MDPVEKEQRDLEEIRAMMQEAERHIKEMREMVRKVDEFIAVQKALRAKQDAGPVRKRWWKFWYE